jgi:hypothetical protein
VCAPSLDLRVNIGHSTLAMLSIQHQNSETLKKNMLRLGKYILNGHLSQNSRLELGLFLELFSFLKITDIMIGPCFFVVEFPAVLKALHQ